MSTSCLATGFNNSSASEGQDRPRHHRRTGHGNGAENERRYLEEAFPEGGVLIGEQASGDVGVGHLQEVEVGAQLQADALLRQQ